MQGGGQLETQSHGAIDLGWRNEAWSLQLFTDTIDARFRNEGDRGRVQVGARAGAFAANMWITPWTAGAPDLARSQRATYVGVDGEAQRYLPGGAYLGVVGFVRPHWFAPLRRSTVTVPFTLWAQGEVVVGVYRSQAQVRLSAGVDATAPGQLSPHARLEASVVGPWTLAPVAQVWAGWARNTDDITAQRLGGLTPYHVPFSGASWAEFWVEDYVVGRAALRATAGPVQIQLQVDAGRWTPPTTTLADEPGAPGGVGLGLGARWRSERAWFAEVVVAHSPTLPRADGVWPVPVWFAVGRDWTTVGGG